MFFDDDDLALKKTIQLREPPPTPDTGWLPPREFPNLRWATRISVDVETWEPDFDHGPGWGRGAGKGHIVGVSIGAQDSENNIGKWYFPVRHEVEGHLNMPAHSVFGWLREVLHTPMIPKVFANGIYDIGWLTEEQIYVEGRYHDVQFAEALLHESGQVGLEHLGQKYVGEGKDSTGMYEWLASAYGGTVGGKQRANIYRASPRLVGSYAESDADLPLRILQKQLPLLDAESLTEVYDMECALARLLVRMRLAGVRVDVAGAERMYDELQREIAGMYDSMASRFGYRVSSVDSGQLEPLFTAAGVKFPTTETGKPSFRKDWLANLDHPLGEAINEIREREKLCGTFLKSYILDRNTNGYLHGSFHPLRSDDGGTRSGRLASSDPNLQNIPARSEIGKRIRKLFLHDYGHVAFEANDYSQIEYRFLAHFAVGPGADSVREEYATNPDTDYHDYTQDLVLDKTGLKIDRKPIKNINFGLLYGMGKPKLSRQIGVARDVADQLFNAYHAGAPYVQATMAAASDEAQALGYVTTIMGRRSRFDLWEPREIDYDERDPALPYHAAIRQYGSNIQRAYTHKAINRRLQGSSADMMKKAMVVCYEAGIFEVTGIPRLTVHDELGFSVPDDSPAVNEAYAEMRRIMTTCIPLRVPVKVDTGRGPNWGDAD